MIFDSQGYILELSLSDEFAERYDQNDPASMCNQLYLINYLSFASSSAIQLSILSIDASISRAWSSDSDNQLDARSR